MLFSVVGSTQEGQHGFAKGFARDRTSFDAHAPQEAPPFHEGDTLSELGGLNCRPLAGRPTPDAEQIKIKFLARIHFAVGKCSHGQNDMAENRIPPMGPGSIPPTTCWLGPFFDFNEPTGRSPIMIDP